MKAKELAAHRCGSLIKLKPTNICALWPQRQNSLRPVSTSLRSVGTCSSRKRGLYSKQQLKKQKMEYKRNMGKIRTDSDLVRIARHIDGHLNAIRDLLLDLEEAEHPRAKDFIQGLDDNSLTAFAWATHI